MRFKSSELCVEKQEMQAFRSQSCAPVANPRGSDTISALIVDDDRQVRSYLRMVLRLVGVTTAWEAANLAEARELYATHRPTVVLLDLELPEISGDEVIRQLLALDSRAAILAVTSRQDLVNTTPCTELGAIGWVPIHAVREEIAQRISAALDRIEQRDINCGRMVA